MWNYDHIDSTKCCVLDIQIKYMLVLLKLKYFHPATAGAPVKLFRVHQHHSTARLWWWAEILLRSYFTIHIPVHCSPTRNCTVHSSVLSGVAQGWCQDNCSWKSSGFWASHWHRDTEPCCRLSCTVFLSLGYWWSAGLSHTRHLPILLSLSFLAEIGLEMKKVSIYLLISIIVLILYEVLATLQ